MDKALSKVQEALGSKFEFGASMEVQAVLQASGVFSAMWSILCS
jgi:hypothetical protein